MAKNEPVPYRKTLFVCVHARADGRVSCAAPGRGGAELAAALKDEVKKAGLKGQVRVVKSGCLDLCEKGPNAFLYPEGEWLSGLSPADAPGLLRRLAD
jgi:(2Fe-2S) ferredoxin